ncbi:hypothetical protein POM88_028252 [Heracleum sosnowskyi]|uniref:Helicase ATP-binding domain-containing protein n=1 Tax=Heracleum sosnowskyi TaxID=360622 RepID=A0AAD8IBR6_9APIA|nr:hypothetical protein POM88_028252 [Heracleum sosnowskyi]
MESLSDRKTLLSVREVAKSIQYSEPLPTGWKPPLAIRSLSRKVCETIRKKRRILVDGEDIPPPISNFKNMRLPEPILKKAGRERHCTAHTYSSPSSSCDFIRKGYDRDGVNRVWSMLCIGGVDMRSQLEILKRSVHIVVATPRRLKDMLAKRTMNLDNCRYLVLDEADRILNLGFEDEIRK